MGGYWHWLHDPFQGGMGKTYSRYWSSFRGRIGGTERGDLGFKVFFSFFRGGVDKRFSRFWGSFGGVHRGMGKGH